MSASRAESSGIKPTARASRPPDQSGTGARILQRFEVALDSRIATKGAPYETRIAPCLHAGCSVRFCELVWSDCPIQRVQTEERVARDSFRGSLCTDVFALDDLQRGVSRRTS